MAELYRYNPHALAHHNVTARAAAWSRGERPEWDPATTDTAPRPPIHQAQEAPSGTQGNDKVS